MKQYRFTLYIAGQSTRSERVLANLRRACEIIENSYDLVIVDILETPEAAEIDKILAIPTLIKHSPEPRRRVIGDLSNYEALLRELDITPS